MPSWPERAALFAILAAALLLRAWNFDRLGLVHFDEGIYVAGGSLWSAYLRGASEHPFPAHQPFYSPPLVPVVFGTGMLVLSPWLAPDQVAIGLSILAGTLTVLVVWRIARRWYGPPAGLAAALLAATSDVHVRFSRMALTDVWLLLFFLLAILALQRVVSAPRRRTAILAGLFAGLAWNAKYNGWLPLVIALVALLAWWRHEQGRPLLPVLRSWGWTALVAGLLFLPWYLFVESNTPGGYAAVVAHHRGYMQPLAEWPANLARQLSSRFYLEGPASWIAPGLVLIVAGLWTRKGTALRWIILVALAGATSLAAWRLGQLVVLAALAGALWLPRSGQSRSESTGAARWFHLVWILVLLVLTPMYLPYARLLLPLTAALWLAGAAGAARVADWMLEKPPPGSKGRAITELILGLAMAAVCVTFLAPEPIMHRLAGWSRYEGHTWEPTDTLRRAAGEIARRLPQRATLFVYGEPALFFYLYQQETDVRRISDLSIALAMAERPTPEVQAAYLVIGARARSESSYPRLASGATAWQQVATIPADPGAAVRLDERAAAAPPIDDEPDEEFVLRLFELHR